MSSIGRLRTGIRDLQVEITKLKKVEAERVKQENRDRIKKSPYYSDRVGLNKIPLLNSEREKDWRIVPSSSDYRVKLAKK